MEQYIVEHGLVSLSKHGKKCSIISLPRSSTAGMVLKEFISTSHEFIGTSVGASMQNIASMLSTLTSHWKLMSGSRFLREDEVAPTMLHLFTGGLLGGKGGFGAMLRAAAKKAGKKPTRDFGACRDLQGRRLRHVNDEIRLRKWQEERERGDSRKAKKGDDEKEETPSGIENWYLGVPSWAEGLNKQGKQEQSYLKPRRKTRVCKQWLAARAARPAPEGAPVWWGCPRGRACDFAHGDDELVGPAADALKQKKTEDKREKAQMALSDYVAASSAIDIAAGMSNAVEQGMKAAHQSKKRKLEQENVESKSVLPLEMGESARVVTIRNNGCSWLTLLAGEASLEENGHAIGESEFCSLGITGGLTREGKWYYEVELLTSGLMQIGWADHMFKGDSYSGDGIGDDKHSWAYDGYRCKKWNGEEDEDDGPEYGTVWKAGDVVGCMIDATAGTIQYTLNGENLGIAFQKLSLPEDKEGTGGGYFPALSLEQGEAVIVNPGLSGKPLRYPIPEGYKAVAEGFAVLQDMDVEEIIAQHINKTHSSTASSSAPQSHTSNGHATANNGELVKETQAAPALRVPPPGPIDLSLYNSAEELTMFGLDRLKAELQQRGIKCGGTLFERSFRLMELKGLQPSDYPVALLAAPPQKKSKGKGKEKVA